jgi:hypothetical protein
MRLRPRAQAPFRDGRRPCHCVALPGRSCLALDSPWGPKAVHSSPRGRGARSTPRRGARCVRLGRTKVALRGRGATAPRSAAWLGLPRCATPAHAPPPPPPRRAASRAQVDVGRDEEDQGVRRQGAAGRQEGGQGRPQEGGAHAGRPQEGDQKGDEDGEGGDAALQAASEEGRGRAQGAGARARASSRGGGGVRGPAPSCAPAACLGCIAARHAPSRPTPRPRHAHTPSHPHPPPFSSSQEIRKYQKTGDLLIPRAPFLRLVRRAAPRRAGRRAGGAAGLAACVAWGAAACSSRARAGSHPSQPPTHMRACGVLLRNAGA